MRRGLSVSSLRRAASVCALAFALGAPLAAALAPTPGGRLAAVYGPWVGREEAVRRVWAAGGRAAAVGAFGRVVVVEPAPGLAAALAAGGAWVIDGRGAAAWCRPLEG